MQMAYVVKIYISIDKKHMLLLQKFIIRATNTFYLFNRRENSLSSLIVPEDLVLIGCSLYEPSLIK